MPSPPWILGAALLCACAGPSPRPSLPVAIHLVDLYRPAMLGGEPPGSAFPASSAEWRFSGPPPTPPPERFAATRGWEAGPGVEDLAVLGVGLTGRTTTDTALLHLERTAGLDARKSLLALEVRLRVSAGGNLFADFLESEKIDPDAVVSNMVEFPWRMARTPIVAGGAMQTYRLPSPRRMTAAEIRHIAIQPTDAAGARFEIESIRLDFAPDAPEDAPSGVSWRGLSEIYRETLVSRSPGRIRMSVSLPDRPWLDLTLGTVGQGPLTFRVRVARSGGGRDGKDVRTVLERTVTRPDRWEAAPVDLSRFAGEKVEMELSLASDRAGSVGFWGSPVIRNRRPASPPPQAREGDPGPPQGVILILADTLRRDHLDAYGYPRPTAPNLRRMAEQGALFEDCVAQATWTKVSVPSILTSLYPTTHGVLALTQRLPASVTTLAEVFREGGYATLSLSSVPFTGQFSNLQQGFEELHEGTSLPDQKSSKTAKEYVDRLLSWLGARREVPFFVLLHVTDPHDPYRPLPPYDTLWSDPSRVEEHARQAKRVRGFIVHPLLNQHGMTMRENLVKAGLDPEAYMAGDRDWYDGSIRGMDAEIGRLLERLREWGLERRTLVVFTGDHGEEFLEHGRTYHGQSTYGELSNVPLVFWRPGSIPAGRRVAATVETLDIMPTILEAARLPAPPGIQGRSLAPLLGLPPSGEEGSAPGAALAGSGPSPPVPEAWVRPAITEKAVTVWRHSGPPPHETESYAIVLQGWKLIHNTRRPSNRPEFELFDEKKDPLNLTDVSAGHPEIVRRLSGELDAWRKKAMAARREQEDTGLQELEPEEIERLRNLGYIQ